ncbi:unannotated protein [freshwater metagenome]|uniref:Unannotated protein n=1 Tax=freshwater metagenome TaxID=449393 RepID=A0A6J7HT54_9ZZZZ
MSARVISRGTCETAWYGIGDGPMIGQFPDSSGWSMPSHMTRVEAFRPAWPIWMPIFACVV